MNKLEKLLPSKANFSTSLQLNCSNFRLNSVKGIRVTKTVKLQAKKMFPETISHKILGTNSSFHVK